MFFTLPMLTASESTLNYSLLVIKAVTGLEEKIGSIIIFAVTVKKLH